MCLTWQILFSLLFLSWSSLFYPPLPFFFLLSSILCSFSQFTFLSLFSLCLCLPIFLAWIFRVFFFPHVITHPSDMSQYCMEVHCRHILVSCCYVFNPSKLTFLYHSFSAQKEAKLKCFWFLYDMSLYLKSTHPKGERKEVRNRIYNPYSQKKKKSQSSKELFKLDPFYPICLVSQLFFFLSFTHHKFIEYLTLARKFRHTSNRLVEGL